MFQSLLNTRHCSSACMVVVIVVGKCFNPYSIQGIVHLTFIGRVPMLNLFVSILTQYKALFIRLYGRSDRRRKMFQSLLNTRHCSSNIYREGTDAKPFCFNPYSIQGIVHHCQEKPGNWQNYQSVSILTQYKALFIRTGKYPIRGRISFQSLLNTRHCSSQ